MSRVFFFFLSPIFLILLLLFCLLSPLFFLLSFHRLLLSSLSLCLSFLFLLLPFFSLFMFLPWLLPSPSALQSPACFSYCSFVYFFCFFAGFSRFLLSLPILFSCLSFSGTSHSQSTVSSCPSPVVSSCFSFWPSPFGRRWLSSSVLSFLSPPSLLLPYPWSPPTSFSLLASVSFLSLLFPACCLYLLFLDILFLFFPNESSVLSFRLCWWWPFLCFCFLCQLVHLLFVWSSLGTSYTFGSFYGDPLLFPVSDDGSVSEGVVFPSIEDSDFLSFHEMLFSFLDVFA